MSPKSIFAALAMVVMSLQVGFAQPINSETKKDLNAIRQHIVEQLTDMDLHNQARFQEEVRICFKLKESGTIELHEVQCENTALKQEIKKELKDMKVETEAPLKDQFYWITVKFKVV